MLHSSPVWLNTKPRVRAAGYEGPSGLTVGSGHSIQRSRQSRAVLIPSLALTTYTRIADGQDLLLYRTLDRAAPESAARHCRTLLFKEGRCARPCLARHTLLYFPTSIARRTGGGGPRAMRMALRDLATRPSIKHPARRGGPWWLSAPGLHALQKAEEAPRRFRSTRWPAAREQGESTEMMRHRLTSTSDPGPTLSTNSLMRRLSPGRKRHGGGS